jgi:hypothetical protein
MNKKLKNQEPFMKHSLRTIIFPIVLIAVFSLFSISTEAQTGITKKVRFARGKSSIVVKGAIVRGTEDRYIVSAKKGQTMSVKISSLEKNANFTVYFAGEQESLEGSVEATKWTGKLSDDNNYVIVVGASRGNATYSLLIGVD